MQITTYKDQDKYLHHKYGFVLCLFFNLFTTKAVNIVSFIAKFKEFVDGLGYGTKDQKDYIATMQGAYDALDFANEYFNRG
jgi:hypothetical protein